MTNQIINKLNKFQSNIYLQHKQPVLAGKYLIQQNIKKLIETLLKKKQALNIIKTKDLFSFHLVASYY